MWISWWLISDDGCESVMEWKKIGSDERETQKLDNAFLLCEEWNFFFIGGYYWVSKKTIEAHPWGRPSSVELFAPPQGRPWFYFTNKLHFSTQFSHWKYSSTCKLDYDQSSTKLSHYHSIRRTTRLKQMWHKTGSINLKFPSMLTKHVYIKWSEIFDSNTHPMQPTSWRTSMSPPKCMTLEGILNFNL
jgi:hypothetical protein